MEVDHESPMAPKHNEEEGPQQPTMFDRTLATYSNNTNRPTSPAHHQPTASRTFMQMTFKQHWPQHAYPRLTCNDLTYTTTIHHYHSSQTHAPTQTNQPYITHHPANNSPRTHEPTSPRPPEITYIQNHHEEPTNQNNPIQTPLYTVENPPDTPLKTPNHDHQPQMTGLSPFLNRMTLKKPTSTKRRKPSDRRK